jgi:hypothetical protein
MLFSYNFFYVGLKQNFNTLAQYLNLLCKVYILSSVNLNTFMQLF